MLRIYFFGKQYEYLFTTVDYVSAKKSNPKYINFNSTPYTGFILRMYVFCFNVYEDFIMIWCVSVLIFNECKFHKFSFNTIG